MASQEDEGHSLILKTLLCRWNYTFRGHLYSQAIFKTLMARVKNNNELKISIYRTFFYNHLSCIVLCSRFIKYNKNCDGIIVKCSFTFFSCSVPIPYSFVVYPHMLKMQALFQWHTLILILQAEYKQKNTVDDILCKEKNLYLFILKRLSHKLKKGRLKEGTNTLTSVSRTASNNQPGQSCWPSNGRESSIPGPFRYIVDSIWLSEMRWVEDREDGKQHTQTPAHCCLRL